MPTPEEKLLEALEERGFSESDCNDILIEVNSFYHPKPVVGTVQALDEGSGPPQGPGGNPTGN